VFKERPSRNPVPVSAETVLSNEIKLEGRLHSSTNIRFDGEMTGDVSTDGDLAVGEHGRIKGNVTGRNVVVGGSIQGNVQTSGRLEILATGKVYGDIAVGSLIIDEGGILRGKSAVHADDQTAPASVPAPDFTTVAA
jgi:cytoskeletal protein CcmA (bactofilin family)